MGFDPKITDRCPITPNDLESQISSEQEGKLNDWKINLLKASMRATEGRSGMCLGIALTLLVVGAISYGVTAHETIETPHELGQRFGLIAMSVGGPLFIFALLIGCVVTTEIFED